MGSTLKQVVLLVISAAIGIGVMYVGTSLMPPGFFDEQTKIIIGIVLTLFAYISFYYMSKGGGGGG